MNDNDNETNKGIPFETYKRIAPTVLEFEKLNYEYFKNSLTNNDVHKILSKLTKKETFNLIQNFKLHE